LAGHAPILIHRGGHRPWGSYQVSKDECCAIQHSSRLCGSVNAQGWGELRQRDTPTAWLWAATNYATAPPLQVCHLRGTDLDVGDGPAAPLRRPGDVGTPRPVQHQVVGRWVTFGVEHKPVRVLLDPSQVACIVILEHLHGSQLSRSGSELPCCGFLVGSRQRSQSIPESLPACWTMSHDPRRQSLERGMVEHTVGMGGGRSAAPCRATRR
jgi:hypothetical protein